MTIDASAGKALMNKTFADAYALIESMAPNHYQQGSEHTLIEKTQPKGGMYEVSSFDHTNSKVDALIQKIDNLIITSTTIVAVVTPNCKICRFLDMSSTFSMSVISITKS